MGVSFFLWVYEGKLDASSNTENEGETLKALESNLHVASDETTDDAHEKFPSLETAKFVTIVVVIGFSSIARLASSGTVIILQKDWIVVISDNDTDYLASMLF